MAERLVPCPQCKSYYVEVLKIHNPETTDMNANATLKCTSCGNTWEGKARSPFHEEQRRRGFCI